MLIRVQLDSQEPEEMCDKETLVKWAEEGRLLGGHKIWDSEANVWILAKDFPLLSVFFAQALWDAWEVEDSWELDPDIETGIRKRKKQISINSVVPEKESSQKVVPTLPNSAILPLEESNQKEKGTKKQVRNEKGDGIKNITRPAHLSESNESFKQMVKTTSSTKKHSPSEITLNRAKLWQPEIPLQDQRQLWVQEEKKKSLVSPIRLSLLVVPVTLLFLGVRWYIVSEATAIFPLEEELDQQKTGNIIRTANSETMFLELENNLKNQIRTSSSIVSRTKSLEDALRIDIEYVNLDIQWINAKVTSWTGRKLDVPSSAEIQIAINSTGVIDEEIALLSLIVARYTERYFQNMEHFSIILNIEDGAFQKDINVLDARKLLLHPGSLEGFLTAVMK
jgi:hypothetical protein